MTPNATTAKETESSSLSHAPTGEWRIVAALCGHEGVRQRLAELGFVRGARVRIVQRVAGGAKVRLNGFNLAMSNTLLRQVLVE
jgi:ferrous iron transport protein A